MPASSVLCCLFPELQRESYITYNLDVNTEFSFHIEMCRQLAELFL